MLAIRILVLLLLLLLAIAGSSMAQFEPNPANDRIFLYRFFQYYNQIPPKELSDECRSVTEYFWSHRKEEWAEKMIDSNSMIESGLINGNIQFLGSFDECLNIQMPLAAISSSPSSAALSNPLDIQYCTLRFPISMLLSPNETARYPPIIVQMVPSQASICYPKACSQTKDLKRILSKYTEMTNKSVSIANCFTQQDLLLENRFELYHIEILVVFISIFLICIVGTFVEVLVSDSKATNWFNRFLMCFSLKSNFAFLFRTIPVSSPNKPKSSSNLSESWDSNVHTSSTAKLTELDYSSSTSEFSSSNLSIDSSSNSSAVQVVNPIEVSSQSKIQITRPQIDCLHGIRFISFLFILIYHTFTEAQTPSANLLKILDAERKFEKQLITNATLWVDTFFLLSGFLVAHTILYQKESSSLMSHLWNHPKRILHRYLRLTPSVAGVLALSILIEPLGSGPLWYQYTGLSKTTCHNNWYCLFGYVNNFWKLNQPGQTSECLSYLWYLAVDMQFFLISPLLIMFLTHKSRRVQTCGILINLGVIGASWAVTAILMATQGLTPTVLVNVYDLPYINLVYKASYCRIGPYCIGILLSYILYRRAVQQQTSTSTSTAKVPSKLLGTLMIVLSIALTLTLTLLTYPWLQNADYHNAPSVLYGTTHRTLWAVGWSLFIYACACGHVPFLNRALGWGVCQFLSKLTYQSYLLHSVLISAVINSSRQKMYFSDSNLVFDIFQYLILTIMASMGTFVLFERPFIQLEQTFFR